MSDVTDKEIEREMPAAWEAVKNGLAGQTLAQTFARALATVRKEARREGLSAAATAADNEMANEGVDGTSARYVLAAIRALMGPGT